MMLIQYHVYSFLTILHTIDHTINIKYLYRAIYLFFLQLLDLFFFFFFFQAEDGIRDGTVTGVQTCALPICWPTGQHLDLRATVHRLPRDVGVDVDVLVCRVVVDLSVGRAPWSGSQARYVRSEERRVGKECRSRWWPYQ